MFSHEFTKDTIGSEKQLSDWSKMTIMKVITEAFLANMPIKNKNFYNFASNNYTLDIASGRYVFEIRYKLTAPNEVKLTVSFI